jgi:hypothetical protein
VRRSAPVARYVGPAVGLVYGAAVTLTFPQHAAPWWLVWAAFAVLATTVAGVVFAYGLSLWGELHDVLGGDYTLRARQVALPVTAIVVGSLLVMNVTDFLPGPAHASPRSAMVPTFAIAGAVPGACVMYGIRRAAISSVPSSQGDLTDLLLALRPLLQRLLAAAGLVVALVTFSAGTWWSLEHSLHTQYGNRPSQFVLIFGAFGTTFVTLLYVPARSALQRRGEQLRDGLFPLDGLSDKSVILRRASDRQALGQVLGLDQGTFADLQGGFVILAPLIASAAAAFLPH